MACDPLAVLKSLDVPKERKEKLVIGLVQLGIDLHGLTQCGRQWPGDGGHWSGRKWPILCLPNAGGCRHVQPAAGAHLSGRPADLYGRGWCGQTALFEDLGLGLKERVSLVKRVRPFSCWTSSLCPAIQ